ncbi:hypothetical protein RQ832_02960 [Roseomonas sp. DSM 102946]|nr:hypothetical protein [Roseomonas sp. DSM 102946]
MTDISRRGLVAAAPALALPMLGVAATATPDAEILRLTALWTSLNARLDELTASLDHCTTQGATEAVWKEIRTLQAEEWSVQDALVEAQARTMEGLRAKAQLLHDYLQIMGETGPGLAEVISLSICRDLLQGGIQA